MSTLPNEWNRLYHLQPDAAAQGSVRALVLELGQPADWSALSALWRGVQTDWNWPAPAIAVNGVDGHQLWFSLAQPVSPDQALQCLQALRARYFGTVADARIRWWAGTEVATGAPVPALQASGHWSAFVAPDLAAIFSDEPWLDLSPSPEAQAHVLSGIACIKAADFLAAWEQLHPAVPPKPAVVEGASATTPAAPLTSPQAHGPAQQFLLSVMNDAHAPLPLRIEAAKALLPYRAN
jgi:hypothetical protein